MKVKSLSRVRLLETTGTAAHQAPRENNLKKSGYVYIYMGFSGGSVVKNPPANVRDTVRSLSLEDPLKKGMATHSNILSWRIPWTEESSGLQSMGLQCQI